MGRGLSHRLVVVVVVVVLGFGAVDTHIAFAEETRETLLQEVALTLPPAFETAVLHLGFLEARVVAMPPPEYEQPAENHASQVRKMGNIVARERREAREEFDQSIQNNKYARTYRHGNKEDEHTHIGEEPCESKQDAEDGSRGTDSDDAVGELAGHIKLVGTECGLELDSPDRLLNECGTYARNQIVYQETAAAPPLLDGGREHEDREHIAEDVREIGVHKDVGQRLPQAELRGGDIVQAEDLREIDAVASEDSIRKPAQERDDEQVAGNGR